MPKRTTTTDKPRRKKSAREKAHEKLEEGSARPQTTTSLSSQSEAPDVEEAAADLSSTEAVGAVTSEPDQFEGTSTERLPSDQGSEATASVSTADVGGRIGPEDEGNPNPVTITGEPPKKSDSQKKWREAHPEKIKDYQKKWRDKNPERVRDIHKQYRTKHPDKVKNWQKQSQANRKKKAPSGGLPPEEEK